MYVGMRYVDSASLAWLLLCTCNWVYEHSITT